MFEVERELELVLEGILFPLLTGVCKLELKLFYFYNWFYYFYFA
jgi:hypothetical protein